MHSGRAWITQTIDESLTGGTSEACFESIHGIRNGSDGWANFGLCQLSRSFTMYTADTVRAKELSAVRKERRITLCTQERQR